MEDKIKLKIKPFHQSQNRNISKVSFISNSRQFQDEAFYKCIKMKDRTTISNKTWASFERCQRGWSHNYATHV